MLRIKNYVRPQTPEEAYQLCQKKGSVVLGGMLWLKMQNRNVATAIDLQDLGLDSIEDLGEEYKVGAMVTLRQLEKSEALNTLTHGAVAESVRHIVGVQFRNLATIGGSIYGRFGFSDVMTLFMALGARVELYDGGLMSVEEFSRMSREKRDLLVSVRVPKAPCRAVYLSQRNVSTDFPVLTCAVCQRAEETVCAVGARPAMAKLVAIPAGQTPEQAAETVTAALRFGGNVRAGAEYRRQICGVLVRRAMEAMMAQEV